MPRPRPASFKRWKPFLLLCLVIVGILATPRTTYADRCSPMSAEEQFPHATNILVGTFVGSRTKGFEFEVDEWGREQIANPHLVGTYNLFLVSKSWKGRLPAIVLLKDDRLSQQFSWGETYLVYANPSFTPEGAPRPFAEILPCSGYVEVSDAAEDIEFLRSQAAEARGNVTASQAPILTLIALAALSVALLLFLSRVRRA